MMSKFLKKRWGNFKGGQFLRKRISLFEVLESGLLDLRGIDFDFVIVRDAILDKLDFSYASFVSCLIENTEISQCHFYFADFTDSTDNGNSYKDIYFSNCKFQKAGLGYNGSKYLRCTFINCNFKKSIFIRAEFYDCEFISCNLKDIDFNGSSFERCVFKGKLEDVWFRGGYRFKSDIVEFGTPKKNVMKNVSFRDASLNGITFSNDCDLATIELPLLGKYYLLDKWLFRLNRLKDSIHLLSSDEQHEIATYVDSHMVHALSQHWYIINSDEIFDEFGVKVGNEIIHSLIS